MDKSPKLSLKHVLIIISALVAILLSALFVVNYEMIVDSEKSTFTGLVGDISIGTLLPFTGDLSQQGEEDKLAIDLAAKDFNEYLDGTNANWNLKIVHEDSATHPVTALEKITSFHDKNINLIIGPGSSGELQNIMEYIDANNMLVFSQSSTAPSLAIPGDTVFRLTPDDSKQGPAIASLLQHENISVIIQLVRADIWGNGLSDSVAKSFSKKQGESQIIRYNPDTPEFSVTTLSLAKAVNEQVDIHGPDNVGVLVIGFTETLQFMQEASEHEILNDIQWFGTDGNTDDTNITSDPIASEFVNKVKFSTTALAVNNNDIREYVEEKIVSDLGRTPKTYVFSAYDIVWILGLAIEEANSSDVEKITTIISNVAANYDGAVGNAKLNEAGDLDTSDYDVWEIKNGKWIHVELYDSANDAIIELHEKHIEEELIQWHLK